MNPGGRNPILVLVVLFGILACRSEVSIPEKVSDGLKCGTTCSDLTMASCVPYYCSSTGFCEAAWQLKGLMDGMTCDDGKICTVGDACEQGSCRPGAKVSCQTSLPCKTARCSGDLDVPCIIENVSTQEGGFSCDDGDLCTPEGKCVDGECWSNKAIEPDQCGCSQDSDCAHLNSACTSWACDVWISTCRPTAIQTQECTTTSQCAVTQCLDPADIATCQTTALPDGMICDDGNDCTLSQCSAGVCESTSGSCNDGNPCTSDQCDDLRCVNEAVSNGVDCPLVGDCAKGQCINGVCQLLQSGTCEARGVAGCSDEGQICNPGHPCVQGTCSFTGVCELKEPIGLYPPGECACGAKDCAVYGLCNDGSPRYQCVAQPTGSTCVPVTEQCCGDGTVEPEHGEYCDPVIATGSCSRSCEPRAFGMPNFNSESNYPAISDRADSVAVGSEIWVFWANPSTETNSLLFKRHDPQSGLIRATQGVFEDAQLHRLNEGAWDVASNGKDRVAVAAMGPSDPDDPNRQILNVGLLVSDINADDVQFFWHAVHVYDLDPGVPGTVEFSHISVDIRDNSHWPDESSEGQVCVGWIVKGTNELGQIGTVVMGRCYYYDCGEKSDPEAQCVLEPVEDGATGRLVEPGDSGVVSYLSLSMDHDQVGWALFGSTMAVEQPGTEGPDATPVEIPYNLRTIMEISVFGGLNILWSDDVDPESEQTIPIPERPQLACNDPSSPAGEFCVLVGYARLPYPQLIVRRVTPPNFDQHISDEDRLEIPLNGGNVDEFQVEFLPSSCSFVIGWIADDCVGDICNSNHLAATLVEPSCTTGQDQTLAFSQSPYTTSTVGGLVGSSRLGGLQLATLAATTGAPWIAASYILQPGTLDRVRTIIFPTTWLSAGKTEERSED